MWAYFLTYVPLDDLKEIVVEKTAPTGDYDEFLGQLPENEPRFAVYDFSYEKEGDGQRSKITFYSWYGSYRLYASSFFF